VERRLTGIAGTPRLRLVAFVSAVALLAALGVCQERENSIEGQVRVTTGGALPSGITVRLEEAENVVVAKQMLGATGKFAFYDLKAQYYQVTVTAEGYQPGTAQVDMHYVASRYPTIYLIPLGAKKTPPAPSASTTDLAAPKKARKEYEQGHEAFEAKDLVGARKHLEKAIEMDPCYARALTEQGVVLSLQGELSAAETSLQKSIHCDGEFLEPYIQLGILLDVEKKYSESESILQQGLRVAQSKWELYYRLGDAHQGLGKYREAEQEYLKAESLSAAVPPEVHIRLADAYLQQREYDRAYTEMQTYLQVAPDGPLAGQTRSFLQRVDSMRKSKPQPAEAPQ
jgi:tetratricopeptide (TPR) repeat protein